MNKHFFPLFLFWTAPHYTVVLPISEVLKIREAGKYGDFVKMVMKRKRSLNSWLELGI